LIFFAIFLSFSYKAFAFAIFFYPFVRAFLGLAPNFFNFLATPDLAAFFLAAASVSSISA
jgi:hypothetical protein